MRIAAIYDVHGNLPALEAVLEEATMEGADRIVFGGDAMPGPMPAACLQMLRSQGLPLECISGNGESEVLNSLAGRELTRVPEAARPAIEWCAGQLTQDDIEWIESWPLTTELEVAEVGTVLFCHATPRSDVEIFTKLTPDQRVAPAFEGVNAEFVVCGHTHMQFDRRIGGRRVVNAGSVGMPFGDPGAYWLLIDGERIEHRRTDYDVESAARDLGKSAMPGAAEWAQGNVQNQRGEAEMLETLEARAMGS